MTPAVQAVTPTSLGTGTTGATVQFSYLGWPVQGSLSLIHSAALGRSHPEPSEKPSALKAPSRPQSAWGKPKHPTPKQNKSAPCASQASVSRKGSPLSKPASAPANAMPPLPLSAESVPEALVVPFIVPPAKSPTLTPAPTSEQGLPFRILYESLQQLQSVQCQSSGQPDSLLQIQATINMLKRQRLLSEGDCHSRAICQQQGLPTTWLTGAVPYDPELTMPCMFACRGLGAGSSVFFVRVDL